MTRAQAEALLAAAEARAADAAWSGADPDCECTDCRYPFDVPALCAALREAWAREDALRTSLLDWQRSSDAQRVRARAAEAERDAAIARAEAADQSALLARSDADAADERAAYAEQDRLRALATLELVAQGADATDEECARLRARASAAEALLSPTRGNLINRAASLGADAVRLREQAERMPHGIERDRALDRASDAACDADEAWAKARAAVEGERAERAEALLRPVREAVRRKGTT